MSPGRLSYNSWISSVVHLDRSISFPKKASISLIIHSRLADVRLIIIIFLIHLYYQNLAVSGLRNAIHFVPLRGVLRTQSCNESATLNQYPEISTESHNSTRKPSEIRKIRPQNQKPNGGWVKETTFPIGRVVKI